MNPTTEAGKVSGQTESEKNPMGIIAGLARLLADTHFSTGDRATLRRLSPKAPDAPAFWHLLFRNVPEDMRRGGSSETRWALIIHGMALMTHMQVSAHQQGRGLGRALHAAGFSEMRLNRLLRARGETFRDMVPRMCRFLASSNEAFDWARFGLMLLTEDEEKTEGYRRGIARDYFRAESAAGKEGSQ